MTSLSGVPKIKSVKIIVISHLYSSAIISYYKHRNCCNYTKHTLIKNHSYITLNLTHILHTLYTHIHNKLYISKPGKTSIQLLFFIMLQLYCSSILAITSIFYLHECKNPVLFYWLYMNNTVFKCNLSETVQAKAPHSKQAEGRIYLAMFIIKYSVFYGHPLIYLYDPSVNKCKYYKTDGRRGVISFVFCILIDPHEGKNSVLIYSYVSKSSERFLFNEQRTHKYLETSKRGFVLSFVCYIILFKYKNIISIYLYTFVSILNLWKRSIYYVKSSKQTKGRGAPALLRFLLNKFHDKNRYRDDILYGYVLYFSFSFIPIFFPRLIISIFCLWSG